MSQLSSQDEVSLGCNACGAELSAVPGVAFSTNARAFFLQHASCLDRTGGSRATLPSPRPAADAAPRPERESPLGRRKDTSPRRVLQLPRFAVRRS